MSGDILVLTFDTATGTRKGSLVTNTLLADNAVVSGKLGSGVIGLIHFAAFDSGKVVLGQGTGAPIFDYAPAGAPGDNTITSAKITSGAVIGDKIAIGGIFSGAIASGAVGPATLLEDAIIVSAKVAANAIGGIHILAGSIVSGHIAAAAIGGAHVANQALTSANYAANSIGGAHILDGTIVSGDIAALAIGGGHIANQAIVSANIKANIIATPHIIDQGILSASFGANVIGGAHIINQGLISANFGAGVIGGAHIINQGITSANFGANVIAGAHIQNYGITSGRYGSGSITEQALVSGISVDISETSIEPGFRAKQNITGYACVYIAVMSGNYVDTALAISGTMPAIGMVNSTPIDSGQIGAIIYAGRMGAPASVVSGQYMRPVFVGTSGQVAMTPPSVSGRCQQIMGSVKDDNEIFLFPEPGYIEIT